MCFKIIRRLVLCDRQTDRQRWPDADNGRLFSPEAAHSLKVTHPWVDCSAQSNPRGTRAEAASAFISQKMAGDDTIAPFLRKRAAPTSLQSPRQSLPYYRNDSSQLSLSSSLFHQSPSSPKAEDVPPLPPPPVIYVSQACLLIPVFVVAWWWWTRRAWNRACRKFMRTAGLLKNEPEQQQQHRDSDDDNRRSRRSYPPAFMNEDSSSIVESPTSVGGMNSPHQQDDNFFASGGDNGNDGQIQHAFARLEEDPQDPDSPRHWRLVHTRRRPRNSHPEPGESLVSPGESSPSSSSSSSSSSPQRSNRFVKWINRANLRNHYHHHHRHPHINDNSLDANRSKSLMDDHHEHDGHSSSGDSDNNDYNNDDQPPSASDAGDVFADETSHDANKNDGPSMIILGGRRERAKNNGSTNHSGRQQLDSEEEGSWECIPDMNEIELCTVTSTTLQDPPQSAASQNRPLGLVT